jgi:mono/diheme cytochrome c family protein
MLRHLICVFVVFAAGSLFIAGANAAGQPKGSTLPEILPSGKGLTLLLDNCSSCHSVVCAVKGQRPVDRWESLKNDHKDKVTGLSDADLNTLFTYLAENFNNNKPEPNLPPELAQQGSCTPF